jgi:hypothetical protein
MFLKKDALNKCPAYALPIDVSGDMSSAFGP